MLADDGQYEQILLSQRMDVPKLSIPLQAGTNMPRQVVMEAAAARLASVSLPNYVQKLFENFTTQATLGMALQEFDGELARRDNFSMGARMAKKGKTSSEDQIRKEQIDKIGELLSQFEKNNGKNKQADAKLVNQLVRFSQDNDSYLRFLLQTLSNKTDKRRAQTARLLGYLAKKPKIHKNDEQLIISSLINVLVEPEGDVRETSHVHYWCIRALADIGVDAVPFLTENLRTGNKNVRVKIVEAMGQMGLSAVAGLTEAFSKESNPQAKAYMGWAIYRIDRYNPDHVSYLISALEYEDPAVRRLAVRALGELGSSQEITTALTQTFLKKGQDSAVRIEALLALGTKALQIDQALISQQEIVSDLTSQLKDPNPQVHQKVVAIFGWMAQNIPDGPIKSVILTQQLKDSNPKVRQAIVLAIGEMARRLADENPMKLTMIRNLVSSLGDTDPAVYANAASNLAAIGQPAAPILIETLKEAFPNLSERASIVLVQMGPATLPLLTEALQDLDVRAKFLVLLTIMRIDSSKIPLLIDFLKHNHSYASTNAASISKNLALAFKANAPASEIALLKEYLDFLDAEDANVRLIFVQNILRHNPILFRRIDLGTTMLSLGGKVRYGDWHILGELKSLGVPNVPDAEQFKRAVEQNGARLAGVATEDKIAPVVMSNPTTPRKEPARVPIKTPKPAPLPKPKPATPQPMPKREPAPAKQSVFSGTYEGAHLAGTGVLASGGELTASQHRIVNESIASFFQEGKARLIDEAFYSQLDPQSDLKNIGAKIYVMDELNKVIQERARTAGAPFNDRVITHPGTNRTQGQEKYLYLDTEDANQLAKLHVNQRIAWAKHEALHLNQPSLSEQAVQAQAPIQQLLEALKALRVEERLPMVVRDALATSEAQVPDKEKRYMLRLVEGGERSAQEVSTAIALASEHQVSPGRMLQLAERHHLTVPMTADVLDLSKKYKTDLGHIGKWLKQAHAAKKGSGPQDEALPELWKTASREDQEEAIEMTDELMQIVHEYEDREGANQILTVNKLLELYHAVGNVDGVKEVIEAILDTPLTGKEQRSLDKGGYPFTSRYRDVMTRLNEAGGLTFEVSEMLGETEEERRAYEEPINPHDYKTERSEGEGARLALTATGTSLTHEQSQIVNEAILRIMNTKRLGHDPHAELPANEVLVIDPERKLENVKVTVYRLDFLNEAIQAIAGEHKVDFPDFLISYPQGSSLYFDTSALEILKSMPAPLRNKFAQYQIIHFTNSNLSEQDIQRQASVRDVIAAFNDNPNRVFRGTTDRNLGMNIRRKDISPAERPSPQVVQDVWHSRGKKFAKTESQAIDELVSSTPSASLPDKAQQAESIRIINEALSRYFGYDPYFRVNVGINLSAPITFEGGNLILIGQTPTINGGDLTIDISLLGLSLAELKAILAYSLEHMNGANSVALADSRARELVAYFEHARILLSMNAADKRALTSAMRKLDRQGWNTEAHVQFLENLDRAAKDRRVKKRIEDSSVPVFQRFINEQQYRGALKGYLTVAGRFVGENILWAVHEKLVTHPTSKQLHTSGYVVPTVQEAMGIKFEFPLLSYEQSLSLLTANRQFLFAARNYGWKRALPYISFGTFEEVLTDLRKGAHSLITRSLTGRRAISGWESLYGDAADAYYVLNFLVGNESMQAVTANLSRKEKIVLFSNLKQALYQKEIKGVGAIAYSEWMGLFAHTEAFLDGIRHEEWNDGADYLARNGDSKVILGFLKRIQEVNFVERIFPQGDVIAGEVDRLEIHAIQEGKRQLLGAIVRRWGIALGVFLREGIPSDLVQFLRNNQADFNAAALNAERGTLSQKRSVLESVLLIRENVGERVSENFVTVARNILEPSLPGIVVVGLHDSSTAVAVERAAFRYLIAIKDSTARDQISASLANYLTQTRKTPASAYEYLKAALIAGGNANALQIIARHILYQEILGSEQAMQNERIDDFVSILNGYPETMRRQIIGGLVQNRDELISLLTKTASKPQFKVFLVVNLSQETVAEYLGKIDVQTIKTLLRELPMQLAQEILNKMQHRIVAKGISEREVYERFVADFPSEIQNYEGGRIQNHFTMLGMPRDATAEMLKRSYRLLAAAYHPDRYTTEGVAAEQIAVERFKGIQQAYDVLEDSERRAEYVKKIPNRAELYPKVAWFTKIPKKPSEGARLAEVKTTASRTRFFLNVGRNLPEGFQGDLPLMKNDLSHIWILSVTKNNQDILLVVDMETKDQYSYDVSNQALVKLHQEDKHDLSQATDLTEEMLKLNEKNGVPVSSPAQATAKIVLVDSFPDLSNNAFYQSLILHFSQTLAQGSQVIFVSQEDGKAEKIASLARTLGVKNQNQFVSMKKEELEKLKLPTSFLLADSYLDQAKAMFGKDQKYFRLQSPEEKDLIGVYALTPIGVLMDWVSVEDWEHAAQLYSQVIGRNVNADELHAALRGALLIPFVSKLIGRLVAQVYMAERAIGGAA